MAGATRIHRGSVTIGSEFPLTADEHHHLAQVLRMTTGGEVAVVEESTGRRFVGVLIGDGGREISVIREEHSTGIVQSWVRTVAFALCKGDHNDLVVEKCTELGVLRIVLFEAHRSVVRFGGKQASKLERFERIARGAALQCGRASSPEVHLANSLQETLTLMEPSIRRFVASLEHDSRPLPELFKDAGEHPKIKGPCAVVIGPEGDLTPEEYHQCRSNSVRPISLGPLILRAETAALAFVAGVNAAWGFETLSHDEKSDKDGDVNGCK